MGGEQATARPGPPGREQFAVFEPIDTRWADNDMYGHINNVAYYGFFDTAVNRHLIEAGLLVPLDSPVIGLVVETGCRFFAPLSYPDRLEIGIRVGHLGRSSVRYELAVFRAGEGHAAAEGHFVHVYVDAASRRPVPLPAALTGFLKKLIITQP